MLLPRHDTADRTRPAPRRGRAFAAALLALAAGVFAHAAAAAESLRIAASRSPVSLPLYVALQRGFFRDEGLDVAIDDCIGGQRCLGRLIDGKADLATASEMPVVLHGFARGDLAIVATIANSSDNLKLIARKASGIVRGEQLDGKKVGVMAGTAAQYLLETQLLNVGVDPRHVAMTLMQAEDAGAALRAGRIDAVAVWEPYGYEALHGAGAVGVQLPLSGGYIETFNIVAGRAMFGAREATLVHLLRAIDRADSFILASPGDAQAILMKRLGLDQHFVDWVWHGLAFRLTLEQSLLTTMESEARWAQREGHAPDGARPNVLTLVYPGPLKTVKPSAVGTGN